MIQKKKAFCGILILLFI